MDGAVRSGRGRGTFEDAHTTVTTEYTHYNTSIRTQYRRTYTCMYNTSKMSRKILVCNHNPHVHASSSMACMHVVSYTNIHKHYI